MVCDAALRGALMSLFASLCRIVRVEIVAVQDTSAHQKSERTWSRKVGFRQIPFSETRISILPSLGKRRSLLFLRLRPSPRSYCGHSSSSAVPPIRQRFSWPGRVTHAIAPHLTHMEARSRSSTGYHTSSRVWPRFPAVSSHLSSALSYCSISSIEHIEAGWFYSPNRLEGFFSAIRLPPNSIPGNSKA